MTGPPPAGRTYATLVHREIVMLAVLGGIAIAAFFGTRAVAAASREWRIRDAGAWSSRGLQERAAGHADAAIRDLRKAAGMDRDSRTYRLALAAH